VLFLREAVADKFNYWMFAASFARANSFSGGQDRFYLNVNELL
jgi:hypothetical protein